MGNIYRFQVNLSGWEGGPGVSTYYARWATVPVIENVQAFADGLKAAYGTMNSMLIDGSHVTIDSEVDVVDEATGILQTRATIVPPAQVNGIGSGSNGSRASMVKMRFTTDKVHNGRLVRGGNYIGPIATAVLDDQGKVRATSIAQVVTAFQGLLDIAGGRLVVWSRPVAASAKPGAPAPRAGAAGFVQSVSAIGAPAVLRSRRD